MTTKAGIPYENNPFMIGIEGLKLIFSHAKGVGIYSVVITAISFLVAIVAVVGMAVAGIVTGDSAADAQKYEPYVGTATFDVNTVVGFIVGLAVTALAALVISLLLFGVLEYAAAMTAKGKHVTLKESFRAVLREFPAYLWMYIIFTVKVTLWTLLFIVPGIIMFNRYILAGTVFFAEGKRGNAAIKRSAELTKGAWLTTYGGAWIWNIVSQGIAATVFWPASMAVLYRQLTEKTDANEPKPAAHILSWLTLLLPIALFITYVILIVLLFALTVVAPAAR